MLHYCQLCDKPFQQLNRHLKNRHEFSQEQIRQYNKTNAEYFQRKLISLNSTSTNDNNLMYIEDEKKTDIVKNDEIEQKYSSMQIPFEELDVERKQSRICENKWHVDGVFHLLHIKIRERFGLADVDTEKLLEPFYKMLITF